MPVDMNQFGKDHWTTFAYIESICVDGRGAPDLRRMRCDATRHPGLATGIRLRSEDKKYPTRLKGGFLKYDHDDWDCVDDLVAAGLVEMIGTGIDPVFRMTNNGQKIAAQLRAWKAGGGQFAVFSPEAQE